ncbi:MAG: YihA family ribosome biogenesis GTP-binding protein [Clostridia bacterium]|nr:YihA family ribosome biogenesis GTP-binding protein [Clostridia bacterium]MBR0158439.1 YihA family ribosome biogenesis GTP-binding protein [Clostridia bacterium]MBR7062846.1 YihA family ribosome biogenesis GTP-binding protein [Clostridia bacterium]
MLVKNPKFVISAVRPEQYPVSNLLEVAFAGRSNAGKSSLINALVNRKRLAYSGSTQGMTRQINFYDLDGELMFVDLPGYGYAAVSKDQKALWGKVVEGYLNVRPQLYMVLLLLDVRRDPSADDLLMYRWIREAELEHAVVLTKCDKLSRMKCRERVSEIRRAMSLPSDVNIFPVSSTDRTGLEALWAAIDSAVEEE